MERGIETNRESTSKGNPLFFEKKRNSLRDSQNSLKSPKTLILKRISRLKSGSITTTAKAGVSRNQFSHMQTSTNAASSKKTFHLLKYTSQALTVNQKGSSPERTKKQLSIHSNMEASTLGGTTMRKSESHADVLLMNK